MKLGVSWNAYKGLAVEEQIRLLAKNGFEATFLASEDPRLSEIVPRLREVGIECENCHAPFKGINEIWKAGEDGEKMLALLLHSVECCSAQEIPVMVVHLSSGENPPRVGDIGCERFDRLMEHSRKHGVTVAYENQRKLGNLAHALECYPDAAFCWDVGHEACFTPGWEYMPLFGSRIAALHLHDNPANYNEDFHMLPYDGAVDMERAARQLAESPYSGSIMLEVSQGERYRDISAEEYYKRAFSAAEGFAERVKFFKAKADEWRSL